MKRKTHPCRPDWPAQVESVGLSYHSVDQVTYWDESAHYELSPTEIDTLEAATNDLQQLCIQGAEVAIRDDWRSRLMIPEAAWAEVIASWERDDLSLYGRFDLLWNGEGSPKLLEYNADTPTGLVEAAVAQWHWMEQCYPSADQFNSLHDQLIAAWSAWPQTDVAFTALEGEEEDWRTLLYLADTCAQAGKGISHFGIGEMGWNSQQGCFTEPRQGAPLDLVFKLYPWEWMWQEEFAPHLPGRTGAFLEPVWKMLWSNKAFLALLWQTFPGHPLLLPASLVAHEVGPRYAAKPIFGREGANVRLIDHAVVIAAQEGPWSDQACVYQALGPETSFDGQHPILGSWIVGSVSAGLGIREDTERITSNRSRFVPHLIGTE